MDMREAFDKWLPGKVIECNEHFYPNANGYFSIWQAACEWQKQKDTELLAAFMITTFGEKNMARDCVNEILNQGKDNG